MSSLQLKRRFSLTETRVTIEGKNLILRHSDRNSTSTLPGTVVGKISWKLRVNPTHPFMGPLSGVAHEKTRPALRNPKRCLSDRRAWLLLVVRSFTPVSHKCWASRLDSLLSAQKVGAGDIWRIMANSRIIDEFLSGCHGTAHGYAVLERLSTFLLEHFFQLNSKISQGYFALAWEAYEERVNAELFLFTTDTGYIASGHAHIITGNFVVILFGSKVPFIPRNIDDGMYRIVDAVYVDGIMAGELIADGANFTETEFKLR
jgi:hypothetical protein